MKILHGISKAAAGVAGKVWSGTPKQCNILADINSTGYLVTGTSLTCEPLEMMSGL